MKSEDQMLKTLGIVTGSIAALLVILTTALILCSCTISFQNIDTHGTASDVVDENQTASPDIKTDLTIPPMGI